MDSDRADQLFPDTVEGGESQQGGITKGYRKLIGKIDAFPSLIVLMVSQAYTYVKPFQSAHFENRHFNVCQLYKAVEKTTPKSGKK